MNNLILMLLLLLIASPAADGDNRIYFREDFNTLDDWKALNFVSIKKHTTYSIIADGEENYLKCESNSSASGLVFSKYYNILEYPKIKWRWKISNVYEKGDDTEKEGDDYPLRIMIMFRYHPEGSSVTKKMKYGIVKGLYGSYPPDTALVYIWANKKNEKGMYTSSYADEEKMIVLEQGAEKAGEWVEEEVNVVGDYRKAYGSDPPSEAGIAIMNDSDNTGEKAVSFIDYIEIRR